MGALVLVVLALMWTAGTRPAAQVAGNRIRVPDDYPTIQGAIDVAEGGDSVLVAQGAYTENLSIVTGLILSGELDSTFISRTVDSIIIAGAHRGRVISITSSSSDTVVTIDGLAV